MFWTNRKYSVKDSEFSDYYGIPYRTVQDWEAEKRELPDYLLRLLKYRAEIECRINSEDT
ncbi:MAG: transcriptional regulator [Pseudobutyrivibrio sp.]|nr:transcriptional regulator [Pseudobutyrivibrio sp.]